MQTGPAHSQMIVDGVLVHFREQSPDRRVIRATLEKGEFSAIKALVPELRYGLIIDAGGYIGTAAIALSRMFPQALIVSVEPSSENLSLLDHNIAPFKNIVALNAALVGVARRVQLFDRRTGAWGFTTVEKPVDRQNVREIQSVRGVTVPDILAQFGFNGVDVLKVDIEGGEVELFMHSEQWISRVGLIVAELHDRIQADCTSVFEQKTAGMRIVDCSGEKVIRVNEEIFPTAP